MATLVSVLVRDVIANRPAASIAGRRFLATDTGVEYHDDGSTWQAVTTDAGQITSGTLAAARLPNPSSSSLGGVQSIASASHQFLTSISTSGVPAAAQPTEADLSLSDITTNNVSITKHGFAPKAPNDATQYLDGTGAYSVPVGSAAGTVTSVALTVPSWLSVSGTPVTTSGTLAVSATSGQTANRFLATPDGSTGATGLRAIAAGDLPLATTGAFGAVKPDGSTITISSGVITSTVSGGMTNPMTTAGDTIYGGASGTPTRLAGGTGGYVYTSNGPTSAPSWQASAASGGLVLLEQHTASTSSELDFTTAITSTYDEYLIELVSMVPATNASQLGLQLSTNGGSSYDGSLIYDHAELSAWINSTGGGGTASASYLPMCGTTSSTASNGGASGSVRLFSPGSSSAYKSFVGTTMWWDTGSTSATVRMLSGIYRSTTATNAFRVFFTSSNITSGTVRVYGVSK